MKANDRQIGGEQAEVAGSWSKDYNDGIRREGGSSVDLGGSLHDKDTPRSIRETAIKENLWGMTFKQKEFFLANSDSK